jgi:hypothetical protein
MSDYFIKQAQYTYGKSVCLITFLKTVLHIISLITHHSTSHIIIIINQGYGPNCTALLFPYVCW